MFCPVLFGLDGPLVLFAFILGECSNPPRGIAESLEFEMEAMKDFAKTVTPAQLKEANLTMDDLQTRFSSIFDAYLTCLDYHFYSFCVLRVVLTWYTFCVVLPYSQLIFTFLAALLMTIFSVGSVFVLIPQRLDRNANLDKLRMLIPQDKKVD